jgi:hypothetical protein
MRGLLGAGEQASGPPPPKGSRAAVRQMRNEALQKRMAELREDPELKGMFEEIQKGGMGALMK